MEPISTAISIGLPLISTLIGEALAAGDQAKADRLMAQAAAQYGPEATKELEAVHFQQLGPSAMEGVTADPEAVAMQRQALRGLQEAATTSGLTAAERADFDQAMSDAAQFEQSQRGAIVQDANARGIGGSGFELAQRLAAQQGSADRSHKAGQQAAAAAARRQALAQMQLGQMAGSFREQGFGEDSAKAQAQDAVSRFNTANANQQAMWKYGAQTDLRDKRYGSTMDQASQKQDAADRWRNTASEVGGLASEAFDRYGQRKKKTGGQ